MLKKNNNNIKLIKKDTKYFLFTSPYENVLKVLNSLKDYLSSYSNSNKAIEELDWVINIISNHLLYYFHKTLYHNKNNNILLGNHKIKDFSFEVDLFNKEFEEYYKKYFQIRLKNEELAKYLSYTEKNISIVNNQEHGNYNSMASSNKKIKSVGVNKKSNKKFFSQFPTQLLNDYNQLIFGNKSITDIYCTDNSGFTSKKNINYINNFNRNKKLKELSFDSKEGSKNNNNNNRNILYNNYRICTTVNSNSINKNKNSSSFLEEQEIIKSNGENHFSYLNNRNHQSDKVISLPLIQFNFKEGINTDKSKINVFKKKNSNTNINYSKTENEQSHKRNIIFRQDFKNNKMVINALNTIDINSIFDIQNFNIFNLRDKLGLENVMPFLGKEIIKKLNIFHYFEESKLDNFLITLSKSYQNTKALYHTSLHGVDVCYSTYIILTLLREKDNIIPNISDLDIVSLVISSMSHDVGHPGLTNKFLINTKNEISIIYNDTSVLENYHCAKTFQLLAINEINIFSNFSDKEFLLLRKKMIGEILATDMAFHYRVIDEFNEYKKNKDIKLIENELNYIIHTADLSHNYRKFEISIRWVELLSNEYWNQGDKEKELGVPISFLCDRNDIDVPKSQVSFINTFSIPTIQQMIEVNPNFEVLKQNAVNNLNLWKKLEKEKRKRGWTPENSEKSK